MLVRPRRHLRDSAVRAREADDPAQVKRIGYQPGDKVVDAQMRELLLRVGGFLGLGVRHRLRGRSARSLHHGPFGRRDFPWWNRRLGEP